MKDWKDRIKGDYSDLRGVCHNPKAGQTKEEMAQQLEYAARLNLNAVRFWMSQEEWEMNRFAIPIWEAPPRRTIPGKRKNWQRT